VATKSTPPSPAKSAAKAPTPAAVKARKAVAIPKKATPEKPSVKVTKQETTSAGQKNFTVRFGSFKNRDNAEALAKKISLYAPAETIKQGELYRVQLKNNYASKQEAEAAAKKIPFARIVIPAI